MTFLKAYVARDTVSPLAPALGLQQKSWLRTPSASAVQYGQYDIKYQVYDIRVAILHTAFMVDAILFFFA